MATTGECTVCEFTKKFDERARFEWFLESFNHQRVSGV